jgi:hypothetical protein
MRAAHQPLQSNSSPAGRLNSGLPDDPTSSEPRTWQFQLDRERLIGRSRSPSSPRSPLADHLDQPSKEAATRVCKPCRGAPFRRVQEMRPSAIDKSANEVAPRRTEDCLLVPISRRRFLSFDKEQCGGPSGKLAGALTPSCRPMPSSSLKPRQSLGRCRTEYPVRKRTTCSVSHRGRHDHRLIYRYSEPTRAISVCSR